MKTMTARFPGRCRNCGATITPGDTIRYSKPTGALCVNQASCGAAVHDDGDVEDREMRFANSEYARGYYETRNAQMAGPAGSAAREAAYMEMEMAAFNRGDDY